MKKVLKCMGMMALVALAFTSCKKNEEKSIIKVSTQELVCVDEDRAYLNDATGKVNFEIGDMCMIFNINEAVPSESEASLYEAIEQGNIVAFTRSGYGHVANDVHDNYYAFYPGGPGHTWPTLEDQNKCKFHVSATQTYRPGKPSMNDLYMCAKSESEHVNDAYFPFNNFMGVLRLFPYEAAQRTVTRIQVVDNFYHLSGWVQLIIPEIDMAEVQSLFNNYDLSNESYVNTLNAWRNRVGLNITEAGRSITLEIPDGVQLGNSRATTTGFDIVLRPLAMSQGSHIIFTFVDEQGAETIKDVDLSFYHRGATPNYRLNLGLNLDNY